MWGFKGFYQGMKVPEGIKLPFSIMFAVTRDYGLSSGPLSISVSHVSFASTSLCRFVSVCLSVTVQKWETAPFVYFICGSFIFIFQKDFFFFRLLVFC